MKQTVTILTALMMVVVLISGFIVMGSMQQSETLMQQEEQLMERDKMLTERNALILQLENEALENRKQQEQLLKEREALSQQLNDAVLSSQESNDAVARQTETLEALQMENEQLRAQIGALEDEATITALAYEQQALEDAQKLQELEKELEEALLPTAAPNPLRVERRVNLRGN